MLVDLTGKKFGRLLVLGQSSDRYYNRATWDCVCECGNHTTVVGNSLKRGRTQSCGCLKRERTTEALRLPAGEAGRRCLFNNYKHQARKRGKEFSLPFDLFTALTTAACFYCGEPPSRTWKVNKAGKTAATIENGHCLYTGIDRVNNDKGYLPDNCVACCFTCNSAKGNKTANEWAAWLARIRQHRNVA